MCDWFYTVMPTETVATTIQPTVAPRRWTTSGLSLDAALPAAVCIHPMAQTRQTPLTLVSKSSRGLLQPVHRGGAPREPATLHLSSLAPAYLAHNTTR